MDCTPHRSAGEVRHGLATHLPAMEKHFTKTYNKNTIRSRKPYSSYLNRAKPTETATNATTVLAKACIFSTTYQDA